MSRRGDRRDRGRPGADEPADQADSTDRIRLDKWLWYARFARTRTLAASYVEEGRVRIGGRRVTDPAARVRIGLVLTLALPGQTRLVEVMALGERREGAPEAAHLYRDLAAGA